MSWKIILEFFHSVGKERLFFILKGTKEFEAQTLDEGYKGICIEKGTGSYVHIR